MTLHSIYSLCLSLCLTQILPALAHLIKHEDREMVSDNCWALSYLTDSSTERIQAVFDSDVVPRLVQLLGSSEISCLSQISDPACMQFIPPLLQIMARVSGWDCEKFKCSLQFFLDDNNTPDLLVSHCCRESIFYTGHRRQFGPSLTLQLTGFHNCAWLPLHPLPQQRGDCEVIDLSHRAANK